MYSTWGSLTYLALSPVREHKASVKRLHCFRSWVATIPPPAMRWSSPLSFSLRVSLKSSPCNGFWRFSQSMLYPLPFSSPDGDFHPFLSGSLQQVLVTDLPGAPDSKEIAESCINKDLKFLNVMFHSRIAGWISCWTVWCRVWFSGRWSWTFRLASDYVGIHVLGWPSVIANDPPKVGEFLHCHGEVWGDVKCIQDLALCCISLIPQSTSIMYIYTILEYYVYKCDERGCTLTEIVVWKHYAVAVAAAAAAASVHNK